MLRWRASYAQFIWELFTTLPQPELQAPPEAIAITAIHPAAQPA
ncbi:MAG: hypothetical protein R3F19_00330 [Verrucomicrobiales bacterium]